METFLAQSVEQFVVFLFILARTGSIVALAPVLGSRNVPAQVKIALSLLVAALLVAALPVRAVPMTAGLDFLLRLGGEALIGVALGYSALLLFDAVQVAGELVGLQMGFGIVNVIDPLTSTQISLIGQFKFLLAVLLFLAIGGHRIVVETIGESFRMIPPGMLSFDTALGEHFSLQFGAMLVLAVKLSAPVLVALLLASFAEGIIARTVPQINIFIVGFGVRIAFGLFMLMLSLGFMAVVMNKEFSQLPMRFDQILRFFVP